MDKFVETSPILDEMLLDVATEIELTENDRAIAERRYKRLKTHLERKESKLRPFLLDSASQIYAQGSMSTSTTIVSGDGDDRCDVDAIVEITVPPHWTPSMAMDALYESLQGFPGVEEIVRCTRCVQLRFARMHMDVTLMDPSAEPRPERQGEIFHVPDTGPHKRVPSNPFGFGDWYRKTVQVSVSFMKALASRREQNVRNRLQETAFEKALASKQDDLAPMIPPHLDSEQVVALKLLKRHLNIEYAKLPRFKRPPSIYVTKHSADVGAIDNGLTDQLIALTQHTASQLRECLRIGDKPDERNPRYPDDRLNDRWPEKPDDMRTLVSVLDDLAEALIEAKAMSVGEIAKLLRKLFGEEISARAYRSFAKRHEQGEQPKRASYEKRTGTVLGVGAAFVQSSARAAAPPQIFHANTLSPPASELLARYFGNTKASK